jgi:8-oxo-dGTP pyrophosphatase MutT (NUDIX family)
MHQNINIYIENNKIIIGNLMNIKDGINRLVAGVRPQDIYYLVDDVFNKKESIQITSEIGSQFINYFKKELLVIEAGGGIVVNEYNEILFIYRNEKWDLPKGKLEQNEDIALCAIREVEEETGCTQLEIVDFVRHTYHIYKLNNRYVLKQTHWFKMSAPKQNLIPQTEEGITAVQWMNAEEVKKALENTYDNIVELF